jgi:hypothetical protein
VNFHLLRCCRIFDVAGREQDFDLFSAHEPTVVVEILPESTYTTNGEVVGGWPAGAGNFRAPEDKKYSGP